MCHLAGRLCPLSLTKGTRLRGGPVSRAQPWRLLSSLQASLWWLLPYRAHASQGWVCKSETEHFIFLLSLTEFKISKLTAAPLMNCERKNETCIFFTCFPPLVFSQKFLATSGTCVSPVSAGVNLHQTKGQGTLLRVILSTATCSGASAIFAHLAEFY